MWLTSVYLRTLRDTRIPVLGWGLGMGLLLYSVMRAVPSLLATPQARADLTSLINSSKWLAEPIAVDTPGGYTTFKYGIVLLVIAIWPLITCSRLLRGEEERGSLDVLLSLPRGRGRVALEKIAAVWTALLCMGLIIGLLTFAGGKGANVDLSLSNTLLLGLNIALICGVFGSLALLFSQFTQERSTASGITGALLMVFIVLDMIHRVVPGTEWISQLSPIYYYNLSKPLIPSYGVNTGAMLILLALNILMISLALILFVRRDIGGTVIQFSRWLSSGRTASVEPDLPVNAWSLRSVYRRSLGRIAIPTFWWTIGIAGFAGCMVALTKQTEKQMVSLYQASPLLKNLLTKVGGGDINTNAALLSTMFVFLPLLLMAFAITQANRWSVDEEDGLHELVLSTPQSRLKVLLARYGALTTAVVIISVLTLVVSALISSAIGLKLDGGNLAAATLSIIPLGLMIAAIGYLLSGWLRTVVDTGILSFLLVIWFFISFIGPELNWSETTLRLSAFYYYGTPLLHGLPFWSTLGVLVVTIAALVLASVRFIRKDIGR